MYEFKTRDELRTYRRQLSEKARKLLRPVKMENSTYPWVLVFQRKYAHLLTVKV